jgi:hypothetical protein
MTRIRAGDIVVLSKRSKAWLDDDEQHLAGSFAEVTKSAFSHDEYVFDVVFPQHKTKLLGVPLDYLHKSIPE